MKLERFQQVERLYHTALEHEEVDRSDFSRKRAPTTGAAPGSGIAARS